VKALQAWAFLAADAGADPTSPLVQYGVLGVLAALLIAFARSAYQREARRADELEKELRRLNDDMRERLVPLMTDVVRVLAETASLHRDRREHG